jgi:hypothetical protein
MIDFRSSAIVESSSHRPCHSPSPGGEGRDEGELSCSSGRQPALIKVGRAYSRAVPFGHFVILSKSLRATESGSDFPKPAQGWGQFLPRLSKAAAGFFQAWPRQSLTFSKPIQGCPRLSKVISEKKDCLFLATSKYPSMAKKGLFTKRTQMKNHKSLPLCWMRKISLASFSKTNPFLWSFKAIQRLSKKFKAFQRGWRKKLFSPKSLV